MTEPEPIPPRWLTRKAAAAYLGIHPITLDRWAADGRIPRYCPTEATTRYDLRDLDAFMLAGASAVTA
jgi:excisionase family DNA binding protein